MDSPGGASSSSASAARRTAGSLRGARMQSGLITPQQMESGDNSPRSSVKEDSSENDLNDQDTQNVHDDWDPADFMAPPNVALTPPGAMIELPSIPVNSSRTDEIRDQDSAPWMSSATSQNPSTDYDWANFVYAYSRGRWDPSRLPRPPNQSNIYPGTTTRINVIQSEVEPTTDPKEEGPSHENLVVRRPSLDYVDRPGLAHRVFSEPDRRTINMSSHTPPPMNNTTLSDIRERAKSTIMSATKGEGNDEKSDTGPLSTGPQFIDPFRMLQIASSSSAPQVGQLTALGDFAQRIIDREQNVTSKTPVGSKTDGEVMKRNNVVRLPSDPSHQREMSNEARILSGRAEVMLSLAKQRRTSAQSTKTTPSLSASTITATRPALAAQVSELSLHANHTSRGNDVKGSEIDSSREKDTDSPRRPDPVPMQSHGSDNLENDQKVPEHLQDSVKEKQKLVALTAAESEEMAFILKDMSEPVQGKESKDTLQLGSDVKLPDEGVNNACINNFQILATKERANSGGDGAGSGSVRKAHQFDQEGPSRRSSVADVSRHMPGILSLVGPTNSSPTLSTHVGLGRRIEAFYKQHGYLPAMMPPDEIERRQAIRRYGPPSVRGNINFERIAHLVKLVFNTKLVLISLVGEETQFFQTEVGAQALGYTKDWLQKIAAPRDCSMCAHAILQPTDEPLVILDTVKDWRFAGNPLVIGEPKIRFYAGTPLRTSDGHNLGTLCIIDDQPWTDFNPRYRHTLREFGRVAMREMELIRETIHLRTQDRMQHSIESFTRECIEMESIESDEDEKEQKQGLHQVYALAAKSMCEALQATGAIVFDLSQFELVVSPVTSKMGKDGLEAGADGQIFIPSSPYQFPEGSNSFSQRQSNVNSRASSPPLPDSLQTSSSEERKVPAMAVLGACESQQPPANREMNVPISSYHRVANFLRRYRTGYFYPYVPAPFRQYLPTNTSNVLLVPIFGLNRQPFALLCAYSHQTDDGPTLEDFKESGLQYLRAMGTIILSAILKKDIMLADKAKSHFISNISHELRTPLHGILAAAELLNETKLNSTQGSYLETVEACGKSLLELVNHVLDFTKLSGNFHAKQMAVKPSQRCDLVKLVQEVCESSWIGQMAKNLESQQNAGIGSAYAHGSEISSSRSSLENDDRKIHLNAGYNNLVETVIDVSMRKSGWLVKCDAGGIRRVLMNLIGNSLKFTSKGFVHVSLREVQSTDKHVLVELGVTDTGKGISRSFLEEQLFHPFTQENHLGPGTGLGLSIVNSIVQSPAINGKIDVWSTVGQGTEIRVTCELELGESEEAEGPIYTPVLNVEHQRSVSFLGFDTEMRGQSDLKDVLKSYFEDWWRFEFLESVDKGDLVLINDDINLVNKVLAKRSSPLPPIILLTGARGSSALNEICDEYQRRGGIVRLLFKPAGPAKLEAVTDFCLQCFERGQAGLPMVDISSAHTTPLPSPAISKDDSSQKDYFITSHEMSTDDAITPKGPPAISTSKTTESSARPTIRPKLSNDLRRNSHHISPGPPTESESALIRRHSSEGRTGKVNVVRENDGSVHTSTADPTLASGNAFPKTSTGIDSNFVDANASSRPLMPTRSITYHEPRLQRHVLMSPLRSPHYRRANNDGYLSGEAMDYFGPAANAGAIQGTYFDGYNHAGSNSTNSNPNSPGSVISLEGGEGAVLRTAIHTAGLMRNHHSINSNHQTVNTPGSNAKSKKRLQILSVEDNSINRKVLAAFFAKMDVDLVEATNGEEGVRVFETYAPFHFDVIFMDLSMPVLDGIGAMTQIRKIEAERFKHEQGSTMAWLRATRTGTGMGNGKNAGSNASTGSLNSSSSSISQSSSITTTTNAATILGTPGGSRPSAQARAKIFALTGRSSDEDKRRAFAMGADGFIVKPLSYKVLSSLINTISVYKGTVPTTTSNHLGASNLNTQSTTTTTTTQSGTATSRGV